MCHCGYCQLLACACVCVWKQPSPSSVFIRNHSSVPSKISCGGGPVLLLAGGLASPAVNTWSTSVQLPPAWFGGQELCLCTTLKTIVVWKCCLAGSLTTNLFCPLRLFVQGAPLREAP